MRLTMLIAVACIFFRFDLTLGAECTTRASQHEKSGGEAAIFVILKFRSRFYR